MNHLGSPVLWEDFTASLVNHIHILSATTGTRLHQQATASSQVLTTTFPRPVSDEHAE